MSWWPGYRELGLPPPGCHYPRKELRVKLRVVVQCPVGSEADHHHIQAREAPAGLAAEARHVEDIAWNRGAERLLRAVGPPEVTIVVLRVRFVAGEVRLAEVRRLQPGSPASNQSSLVQAIPVEAGVLEDSFLLRGGGDTVDGNQGTPAARPFGRRIIDGVGRQ